MEHPTFISSLKAVHLFAALCIILLFPLSLSAQTKLVPMDPDSANMEAITQAQNFGFAKVYVSGMNIQSLLNVEGSGGIRFYTAFAEGSGSSTIIAAAVDKNGAELGDYIRMDSMSSKIGVDEARADVTRSKESELTTLAVVVTSSDFLNILMKEGADGVHIKPGNGSFILIAAKTGENGTGDYGTEYMKHAAPCPRLCGDDTLIRLD